MKGRKENTTKKGDIKLQSCKRLGPATTEWLMVHTNASLHIDSEKFLRRSESGVRLGLVFKVKQISTIFDEVGARSIQLSRNRSEAETSKHAGGVYGAPCPKSSSVCFYIRFTCLSCCSSFGKRNSQKSLESVVECTRCLGYLCT